MLVCVYPFYLFCGNKDTSTSASRGGINIQQECLITTVNVSRRPAHLFILWLMFILRRVFNKYDTFCETRVQQTTEWRGRANTHEGKTWTGKTSFQQSRLKNKFVAFFLGPLHSLCCFLPHPCLYINLFRMVESLYFFVSLILSLFSGNTVGPLSSPANFFLDHIPCLSSHFPYTHTASLPTNNTYPYSTIIRWCTLKCPSLLFWRHKHANCLQFLFR